ncbi:MAG: undecaprenyl-diphosphate phosphatase [Rhodospirillales bacterium]|nr:undecaprenyl-diphosphate phosphatase [Rhodospirillales bacterium]
MNIETILSAAVLGVIEGATEYLPVSSTGHLIIFVDLLGFVGPPGRVFEIVIQFGAVLAVCVLYFQKLWAVLFGLASDRQARRFAATILLAFAPAVVLGVLLHGFIKAVLFSPYVVCWSLILGGIAILLIERWKPAPRIHAVEQFPFGLAFGIGLIQCLAMIPGVSRSGATILGAMVFGVDRKTATEFSFFLAIPTIFGAAAYDLWKNREGLTAEGGLLLAVGFVVAFATAMLTVRWLIGFVGRHSFAPFAWYRIALGALLIAALSLRPA